MSGKKTVASLFYYGTAAMITTQHKNKASHLLRFKFITFFLNATADCCYVDSCQGGIKSSHLLALDNIQKSVFLQMQDVVFTVFGLNTC